MALNDFDSGYMSCSAALERREVRKTESRYGGLNPQLVRLYFDMLGPVSRVLDLGCGRGDIGRYKPSPSIDVVGVDRDLKALELASCFEATLEWDGESERLPFEDQRFDGIIAKDILEHLREPWRVVAELYRVLKPGGAVVVSVPMPKPRVVWDDYTHIRGFTARALRAMFEDLGFTAQRPFAMGGVPLMGRLRLVRWIPGVLRIPPARWLFGRSYTMLARRPASH